MTYLKLTLLLLLFTSIQNSTANNIVLGEELPELTVKNLGQLHIKKNGAAEYIEWSSDQLLGRALLIQYIAARLIPGNWNTDLNEALLAIDTDQQCRTVSIINIGDAIWGSVNIAKKNIISNKKRTPLCTVVVDMKSTAFKAWQVIPKNNATIVIDKYLTVRYFYEGKLSANQIKKVIALLNSL